MPDGHVIRVAHFSLIQWNVDVESFAWSFAYKVEIALTKIRPEGPVLVAMNGKVQHPIQPSRLVSIIECLSVIKTYRGSS